MNTAFTARCIAGDARGKQLGTPTYNLDLSMIPDAVEEGVYAARIQKGASGHWQDAVIHYGPRPVFAAGRSFEVHVLDQADDQEAATITVQLYKRIRDIQEFASPEALQEQITADIAQCRAILAEA